LGDTTGGTDYAVLNVYHGGTLNFTTTHSGDTNFGIGMAAGVTGVLTAIGGTINNKTVNSPITLGYVVGSTALLNIDSDSSGNVGLVVTSYLKAVAAQTSAYVNFNGGELEFANNANAAQTNFITTAVQGGGQGGVYIYAKGAIIGTNAAGGTAFNVTIPSALRAPAGQGITSISFTPGTGYTAPPLIEFSGGSGSGASAYATINSAGSITSIVVTSPGFGYTSAPTINIVDGGTPLNGNGAAYPFTAATASATLGTSSNTGGGLTKVDTGTLILSATNTYTGPTLITAGTVQFNGASNATTAIIAENTATAANATTLAVSNASNNNNIKLAATILVGDQPATGSLPNVGSFTINNTGGGGFILNSTAVSSTAGQTLAGFGKITGSSTIGLTIPNQTVIAPGTGSGTAVQTLTATPGSSVTTSDAQTATFNTAAQGNATGTATGALALTGAGGMTTTFAPGGTYYWKLNQFTGGSGSTLNAGVVSASDVTGANWDALALDALAVTATPSDAFTIQAVSFIPSTGSPTNAVTIGGANTTNYSWTIARVGTGTGAAPNLAGILANLSLNTAGLPAPADGYGYFLGVQTDTANSSDTDLVINYAPTPEPSALALFAPFAGLLLHRRRWRAPA
jgi:autotransporter-associated beta strand protein